MVVKENRETGGDGWLSKRRGRVMETNGCQREEGDWWKWVAVKEEGESDGDDGCQRGEGD